MDRGPYGRLRSVLSRLPPTGDRGFEGLIAAASARLAGVPFRLVGSGRQFGRDGEGTVAGAAVMFEAKRYTSRLPFEALSAKLNEAVAGAGRGVEVWFAAATVPFDAAYAGELRRMGDRQGTTVLVLDWAQPSPPLAVLLAAARDAVLEWFGRNGAASIPTVASELAAVAASPMFCDHADAIGAELRAGTLGLAAARRTNAAWLDGHFRDVGLALDRFNQALAPLDASMRPVPIARPRLEGRIRDAMSRRSAEPLLVVLTGPAAPGDGRGDEGNGKSWAAVRAWLGLEDGPGRPRPMLLLMTSHMWCDGDERRPMALLARLAADQTGSRGTGNEGRWQERLERWLAVPEGSVEGRAPAVVLVLDGVNERTHHPWPALISALMREARTKALGVVVTTRRGIYERDLAPRLTRFGVMEIEVEAFSDEELDHLLMLAGRRPEEVREPLRGFLRNPRVLSVGLDLLDELDPDEVGTERLLFEYLRRRQEERAPAGGHGLEQLLQTLVAHAREIRGRLLDRTAPRQALTFDERTMPDRLGLPVDQALSADLGDIIDSGFIEIVDGARRRYALRGPGRALGLGLLVVEELEDAVRAGATDLGAALEAIVDPIRAIDETALVLLGALDIATKDRTTDGAVARALLHRVLTLQNLPPDQRARIFSGLRVRPDVFVDVAALLYGGPGAAGRREWMRDALVAARDLPATAGVVDRAVRRWLRAWQPVPSEPDLRGYPDEQALDVRRHYEDRVRRHLADLEALTVAERDYVEDGLIPLPPGHAPRVDELAIAILAGRPLAGHAGDIFAWCVAGAAGWETGGAHAEMEWLRLLHAPDWAEAASAVGGAAAPFRTADRSDVFGWAVYHALAGSGDPEQSLAASDARPPIVTPAGDDGPGLLPDVDPLDPASTMPAEGMDGTAQFYRETTIPRGGHPPSALMREADTPANRAMLLLCRFAPEVVADIHRDFAAGCAALLDVSPTVVAHWILRDVPIMGPVVEPIAAWMAELRARTDLRPVERNAPTALLAAILPHLDAERQYDAHAGQRDDADDCFRFGELFLPLPDAAVGERMGADFASEDPRRMRLALLATADAGSAVPTVRSRAREAIVHGGCRLRAAAHRAMMRAGTQRDDEEFAETWSRPLPIVDEAHVREDYWGSLRFMRAGLDADEPAALAKVTPALRSSAIERTGIRTLEAALADLHRALAETDPVGVLPAGMKVAIVRPDDLPVRDEYSGAWHRIDFGHVDGGFVAEDGTRRPMRDMRDFHALQRALASSGREALLHPPSSAVVDRAARDAPAAFGRLIELAEAAAGTGRAPLLAVLAHDVARALSRDDPARAARLFLGYADVEPLFPEVLPICLVPRTSLLLWRSADDPAIDAIRRTRLDRAPNDFELARTVLAAEIAGRHDLIVAYVLEHLKGRHPVDLARAVTTAGFAVADPALDGVFDDPRFRHGFLSAAASKAKRSYDLARWAAGWHDEAAAAVDGLTAWCALELALTAADARCALWFDGGSGGDLHGCQRSTLQLRFSAASRGRNRDRKGTLYGRRVPAGWLGIGPVGARAR